MEPLLRSALLYDFYSELLTDKQRTFFELHKFSDLSLNEIGAEFGISPQGVSDLLKRTERILEDYEVKLRLLDKHTKRTRILTELIDIIDSFDISPANKSALNELLREL